jgi:RNA polymerase sigma-70 factor (ECF subfamily)
MPLRAARWSPVDRDDDVALVVAARDGQISAQEALFRKCAPLVNGLAFRLMGNREDLDDLVQDSFLQAFRSLDRLENPAAFRSWLSEIVVRMAYNLMRRRRMLARFGLRTSAPIDVDALVSPTAPSDVAGSLAATYGVMQRLPAKVRVALVLRRIEGRQLTEVATLMGASLASVKRWLRAADRALGTDEADGVGKEGKLG